MMFKYLAVVSVVLTAVTAQSSVPVLPSGVPAPDACILQCISSAATTEGCGSYTNITCVCTSSAFQTAAESCLKANCTAADQAAALQLQSAECGGASSAASGSTSASASGASKTSPSSPSSSASASHSAAGKVSFGKEIVAGSVALVGALVGAGLVL